LITYLLIYAALIVAYIGVITYLARKAAHGDAPAASGVAPTPALQPGE
jgi:cytochrome d ubiquinol oxidase subunit I